MTPHISFQASSCTLTLLDQRLLPRKEEFFICSTCEDIIFALQAMVVRGAPAIGVTAAFGCVLAANQLTKAQTTQPQNWEPLLEEKLAALAGARPTAVNLRWAVTYMRKIWRETGITTLSSLVTFWQKKANALLEEDIETNKIIGRYGEKIVPQNASIMTHCNAGALATGGFGTALGIIYAAHAQGKKIRVIANETRPFLQGARLTAYELQKEGVPVTVACDNASGLLMKKGMVDLVVVGADRIAANGDTANKIGTYSVALLAHAHNIPFYVAAPLTTIDLLTSTGDDIPIEERAPDEVTSIEGTRITPIGVPVVNFAFDITPAHLITGIITEQGLLTAPYTESILAAYKCAEGNNK